jgi:hypothetical protein
MMGKVGRFVIDPRAGAYCQVSLDSGERILVSHDKGGFAAGAVTIQEVRWWGLASGQTLLTCDLGREEGRSILARLVEGAAPGSARATPLGAFVVFFTEARAVEEATARWAARGGGRPPAA